MDHRFILEPINESGSGIEEEYKDNILQQIEKTLTKEEYEYFIVHMLRIKYE